jgi:AcrR family transcriptional regulator
MEQVALAAGMHVQTLYRHFPSKADLAAAIQNAHFEEFEQAFLERDCSTLVFWRSWVQQRIERLTANGVEKFRQTLRDRLTSVEVPAVFVELDANYESLLADGLAKDMGVTVSADRRPMLIACMLWSSYKQLLRDWALAKQRRDLVKDAVALVDSAIDLLVLPDSLE